MLLAVTPHLLKSEIDESDFKIFMTLGVLVGNNYFPSSEHFVSAA